MSLQSIIVILVIVTAGIAGFNLGKSRGIDQTTEVCISTMRTVGMGYLGTPPESDSYERKEP